MIILNNYIEKEDEQGINKNDFSRSVITENYNKRINKKYNEENKSHKYPYDYKPKVNKKIRSKSKNNKKRT
jgi:hypothetical protein